MIITRLLSLIGSLLVCALFGLAFVALAWVALEQDEAEIQAGKIPWSGYHPDLHAVHHNP